MVQVDIIWSYAFGASFAAASARKLTNESKIFNNPHFIRLMVYLSVLFGPSGVFLLWAFPRWETMQVATSLTDIPPWLITGFAVTNVTQGIIGYSVGYYFARRGEYYKANINWFLAWVIFWFVLACGWDTTGWQRFLYDPLLNNSELWQPGRHNGLQFFIGPVFTSLLAMACFFAPALQNGVVDEYYKGLRLDPKIPGITGVKYLVLVPATYLGMFAVTLNLAILISFVVRGFVSLLDNMFWGYVVGLFISMLSTHYFLLRRGKILHRYLKIFYVHDKHDQGSIP